MNILPFAHTRLAMVVAIMSVSLVAHESHAQQPGTATVTRQLVQPTVTETSTRKNLYSQPHYTPASSGVPTRTDPRTGASQQLRDLRKKLKEAAQGEQRKELTAKVEAALGEYFDHDLKYRQGELDRLKKRADRAEAQMQKRLSSRSELVDLQLKSFRHAAEGLDLLGEPGEGGWAIGTERVTVQVPVQVLDAGQYKTVYEQREYERPGQLIQPQLTTVPQVRTDRIAEARRHLHAADNADEEARALEDVKTALGDYFDADMELRRKELDQVRHGLTKMEARLEKRANSKIAVVELQLQLFVNEADGLGFFSGGEASGLWPTTPSVLYLPAVPGSLDAPATSPQLDPAPALPALTPTR